MNNPFYSIHFANGQQFVLKPTDMASAITVKKIVPVMQLSQDGMGCEFFIATGKKRKFPAVISKNLFNPVCCLSPWADCETPLVRMAELANSLALQTLPRGGLLLHGALISIDGNGIILAAKGGTGKTTACNRLKNPWKVLSDDATLVIPDGQGRFLAHPYPTWSSFLNGKTGGSWHTNDFVPLKGIFLLKQSNKDFIQSVSLNIVISLLTEAAYQLSGFYDDYSVKDARTIANMRLDSIEILVKKIPVNLLHISLNGSFWEEIEKYLISSKFSHFELIDQISRDKHKTWSIKLKDKNIPVVCNTNIMNPTLMESDLLEVSPYYGRKPRIGDVICYNNPENGECAVTRIIKKSATGFYIKGDNESVTSFINNSVVITGFAIALWSNGRYKSISSGYKGRITRLNNIYKSVIIKGIKNQVILSVRNINIIPPQKIGFKVVIYLIRSSFSCLRITRLFFGSLFIGEYINDTSGWNVIFPYYFLIDLQSLPRISKYSHNK